MMRLLNTQMHGEGGPAPVCTLLLSHTYKKILGWVLVLSGFSVYKLSRHQCMHQCNHCCGGKPGKPGLGAPACGGGMPGLQPGGGPPGNPGGGIPGRICKTQKPWLTEASSIPKKQSFTCVCMHVRKLQRTKCWPIPTGQYLCMQLRAFATLQHNSAMQASIQ